MTYINRVMAYILAGMLCFSGVAKAEQAAESGEIAKTVQTATVDANQAKEASLQTVAADQKGEEELLAGTSDAQTATSPKTAEQTGEQMNPFDEQPEQQMKPDRGKNANAKDSSSKKNNKKNKKKDKADGPEPPIVIEADQLSYSEDTGEVLARGNVQITQLGQQLQAEEINGNTKLSDFWVKEQTVFTEPGTRLTGVDTFYNYKMHTGTMQEAFGIVDRERLTGKKIDIYPQSFTVHDGTTTGCPAKIPDYHMSADRIEIWPGDKLIAYNAKFWIKKTVIYTMAKYQKSLKKGEEDSAFPQISYNNKDGLGIRQHLEYPLTDRLALFGDPAYYTKKGFKPAFGAIDRERNYSITLFQGHSRDNNNNWIKKEPEFAFSLYNRQLGDWPVTYYFNAIYGKWTDDVKSSWHQDYTLYFTRDPIILNPDLKLYLGMGYEIVKESYDGSQQDIFRYDATLGKNWTPRLYTWVGYHYTRNQVSLFNYNNDTPGRELASGFIYNVDRMNSIGVSQSYDMQNSKIADVDYTWYRNLHCWQATLTYRSKRQEWNWNISLTRW